MKLFIIIFIQLMFSAAIFSQSDEFIVIVNKENPINEISKEVLSDIFLKKMKKWDDNRKITPINQITNNIIREKFSKKIHSKSISQIKSYWQQSIFSGKGAPPIELDSDEEVIKFVTNNKYSIGYINKGSKSSLVKELSIKNE